MALFIEIVKVGESDTRVDYSFGVSPEATGKLSLEKATGNVTVVEAMAEDTDSRYAARACHKISQHWKKGEIPDRTCWAS